MGQIWVRFIGYQWMGGQLGNRNINTSIIHCSDSKWGSAFEINKWHIARGWTGIGYHYVVLNDYPTYKSYKEKDPQDTLGSIEKGRPDDQVGAHVVNMNLHSLGICMIGVSSFRRAIRFSTVKLTCRLMKKHNIAVEDVIGHCETLSGADQGKTCPNIDMIKFRRKLRWTYPIYRLLLFK